jgi:hypothetical protein
MLFGGLCSVAIGEGVFLTGECEISQAINGGVVGIEKVLLGLADRILDFDEASLSILQEQYLKKVSDFTPTRDWERAIIVYFLINSVRVKNKIFNERLASSNADETPKVMRNLLKVVK